MKKVHLFYLVVSLLGIFFLARYTGFSVLAPSAPVPKGVASRRAMSAIVRTLHGYGLTPSPVRPLRYGPDSVGLYPASSWKLAVEQDVSVTIPGIHSQGRILVYAQVKNTAAPGDSVGGNASAALLQLMGALRKRPRLQNDVTFHFSTARREASLGGATFRELFSADPEHDVLLEIEHRDKGGDVLLFFASRHHYQLVRKYAQLAPPAGAPRTGPAGGRATTLAFLEYLGNTPLRLTDGPAKRVMPLLSIPQTGTHHPGLQAIDAAVHAFLKKWKIPGAAVAITKDGNLVYNRGFGYAHRQSHTPMEPTHRFRIASLSKPITSAAILLLLEQGRLRLDSRVFGAGGILSDASYGVITDRRAEQITVRHLLEHSAGWDRQVSLDVQFIPAKFARILQRYPPADNKSIIRYALSQPLDFSPGTRYAYSNVGYAVLGRIIEQLSGMPYEAFVQTQLLGPLGIRSMRIGSSLPGDAQGEEVEYYDTPSSGLGPSVFGGNIRVPRAYGGYYLEVLDASAGWIASAAGLARFLVAVDGFATKPDVLQPATLQLMTTPTPALRSGYGLGWWVNAEGSWCHTGSLHGSSSLLERTRDGYTWAVLLNSRPSHRDYYPDLSRLLRAQVKRIREWPAYDLFQLPENASFAGVEEPDTSFHAALLADTIANR